MVSFCYLKRWFLSIISLDGLNLLFQLIVVTVASITSIDGMYLATQLEAYIQFLDLMSVTIISTDDLYLISQYVVQIYYFN